MKSIQIPEELFFALLKYHLAGITEILPEVERGLESKMEAMLRRELYSKYKTALTEEEKEKARKEYLDMRGVHESFRW